MFQVGFSSIHFGNTVEKKQYDGAVNVQHLPCITSPDFLVRYNEFLTVEDKGSRTESTKSPVHKERKLIGAIYCTAAQKTT